MRTLKHISLERVSFTPSLLFLHLNILPASQQVPRVSPSEVEMLAHKCDRRQRHLRGPQQRGPQGRSGGAHRAYLGIRIVAAASAGSHRGRPPCVLQHQRCRRLRPCARAAAHAPPCAGRPAGAAPAHQRCCCSRHPAALQVRPRMPLCWKCTSSCCVCPFQRSLLALESIY